MIETLLPLH